MTAILLILALLVLAPAAPVAAENGRLETITVRGAALEGSLLDIDTERSVLIYLPPSYDDEQGRFPTVFVLHGILDSNTTWTRSWNEVGNGGYDTIQALMDQGIARGILQEMILVIPDVDKSCHYTDSKVKGGWNRFVSEDLVGYVDANYRTRTQAAARGIMGHSMGGHGAIKLGMLHPEIFSVVYALNPSLLGWGGDVSPENKQLAALSELAGPEDLAGANFYVQAIVGVGQAFSPNPGSPFLTDFPFAVKDGELVASSPGFERWQQQMPIHMLPDYIDNLRALRGLRFDSAFEDEFSHIPVTSREFSRSLSEKGIAHTFEMYNGDHRNRLWGRSGRLYTEALPYFSALLAGE